MRNAKQCPKCRSSDIVRIPHATWLGSGLGTHYAMDTIAVGRSAFSAVKLTRYLCGACGFTEEWVDSMDDVATVKKKYAS
jgi:ribosomal protein S27AE